MLTNCFPTFNLNKNKNNETTKCVQISKDPPIREGPNYDDAIPDQDLMTQSDAILAPVMILTIQS